MTEAASQSLIKVLFEVDTGDGPLPPVEIETLWAEPAGKDQAVLRNVPFFACGVALGDLVQTRTVDGGASEFVRVLQPADASTVHAFVFGAADRARLIPVLLQAFCVVEIGPIPAYLAIHVPSMEAAGRLAALMEEFRDAEMGDFQVSCSRHAPALIADVDTED